MQALQQAMRLLLFLSSLLFVSVRPQKLPVVINTWVRLCLSACQHSLPSARALVVAKFFSLLFPGRPVHQRHCQGLPSDHDGEYFVSFIAALVPSRGVNRC